jgi:hypothetical protein
MLWLINQATAGEITGQSGQSGGGSFGDVKINAA